MYRNSSNRRRAARGGQSGFTLLEMAVAMVVMMIGLMSLAQVLGYALAVSNRGRGVTNSKLLVISILEQMENLRNTGQLTYGQIANPDDVDNSNTPPIANFGGFKTDWQPVSINPGTDGIYGTSDDPNATDQVYPGFERKIEISPLNPNDNNIKKIEVSLRFRDAGGVERTMTGTSYLNNDTRSNILR